VSVGAVYLRVTSPVADELVGADVDASIAGEVQLHTTETAADGTATMAEQMTMPIPAGGGLVLEPIGNHLMLVGLVDPLTNGETFDMTLHFATAGDVAVEVEVRDTAP
jgi:copper(I)-binding protein